MGPARGHAGKAIAAVLLCLVACGDDGHAPRVVLEIGITSDGTRPVIVLPECLPKVLFVTAADSDSRWISEASTPQRLEAISIGVTPPGFVDAPGSPFEVVAHGSIAVGVTFESVGAADSGVAGFSTIEVDELEPGVVLFGSEHVDAQEFEQIACTAFDRWRREYAT